MRRFRTPSGRDLRKKQGELTLSIEAARAVVTSMLGAVVDDVEQVPSFAGNQVFRARCGDRVVFLKVAGEQELRAEVAVLVLLASRGVPVPIVEAFDADGALAGSPSVLLRHVGGRPVDGSDRELDAVGAHLRAVHDITLDGFGSLDARSDLRGEDPTWSDTVRRRTAATRAIADSGLVPAPVLDRAAAAVDSRGGLFTGVERGHLLHGDFHPRHVFAADGRVTGIIDWGDATCGDPVYDLARIAHAGFLEAGFDHGLELVARVRSSYGDAEWIPAELTPTLLVYAVVFVLWSMAGELDAGAPWPPWWPWQTATLVGLLDELDRL